MGANELSSDLGRGRRRFQAWRARRVVGDRIPPALWDLAVRLAKARGISRTALARIIHLPIQVTVWRG